MNYDLTLERNILATFLLHPETFEESEINPEAFYLPAHKNIYEAMLELEKRDLPIDDHFIEDVLTKQNKFDDEAYTSLLASTALYPLDVYIIRLTEFFEIRCLYELSTGIKVSIEQTKSVERTINDIKSKISDIENISITSDIESGKIVSERIKSRPKLPKFQTGIDWFDRKLNGGFVEGSFINIAAENFAGKSTFVLEILKNISSYNQTLFFSFEMYETLLFDKIKDFTDTELENLKIEQKRNSLLQIVSIIKKFRKSGGRFIAIDSRMKIRVAGVQDEYLKNSEISSVLSKLCQELGVIIILINQVSEQDLRNKRLSLKGSGDQAYDSDAIFYITVEKKDNGEIIRTLHCAKDRHNGRLWSEIIPDKSKQYYQGIECEVTEFKVDMPTNVL